MRTLLGLLVSLGLVGAAHAAPGDLDTTFSGDGLLIENSLASTSVNAIAIDGEGRIVVVGGSGGSFAVLRYNRNGVIDRTFGGTGIVLTGVGGASSAVANAVAIRGDGRIMVAGRSGGGANRVGLARYNGNGTLDTTFSADGIHVTDFGDPPVTGGGQASGVALLADGRIVVVGSAGGNFAVLRLNANGTPDTTFGPPGAANGFAFRDAGGPADRAAAVAVAPDGRVVVAGTGQLSGRSVFVWDYINDGLFSFVGPGGADQNSAQHAFIGGGGTSAQARALAIQPDGKVILAGELSISTVAGQLPAQLVSRDFAIARFNPDGSMDTTFGAGGLRTIDFGPHSSAFAVAVQIDGKIVVAGEVDPVSGFSNRDFAVARLNADGSLDSTFSGDGRVITSFTGGNDSAAAVAVQPTDGRIVAAGVADSRMALARYHAMTCNGRDVTRIGTNGADTINGTAGDDVIHGLAGNDTIDGGDGNDTICGGDGADVLRGSGGNDTLNAGIGADSMNGGLFGRDTCLGSNLGPVFDPADTFFDCETATTGVAGVSGEWLELEEHCNGSARNPQCRLAGRFRVFNPGTESTLVRSTVAFYLSDDAVLDDGDTFLTTESVAALAAGGDDVVRLNVRLGGSAAGRFVIGVVDAFNDVPERNETNNVAVSPPVSTRRNGKGH